MTSAALLRSRAGPAVLFTAGALLMPAFLLQQDIAIRAIEIGLFFLLDALAGRRVRLVSYAVVGAGIVAFNLVIPTGRVLAQPLGLPITDGALRAGLYKATAMIGLIALSLFSIRSDLRIPGRLGGIIGRSLYYFDRIVAQRPRIDRRDIIGSIDSILIEVHGTAASGPEPERGADVRSAPSALVVLFGAVCLAWGALLLTKLHPHLIRG